MKNFPMRENFPATSKVAIEWAMSVVTPDGETTNYSQEMMFKYYKEQTSSYEPLYNSEEEAQAAIDGYVATLNISDDDTVYEKTSMIIQPQASMVIMDQSSGRCGGNDRRPRREDSEQDSESCNRCFAKSRFHI